MKNIYVLPTDKPSRLFIGRAKKELFVFDELANNVPPIGQNQNIYITSDEEIKDGDYYLYLKDNSVQQFIKKHHIKLLALDIQKKIILTTDQDLIADGIQAIDDNFIEWFVKNPSCEKIKFEVVNDNIEWYKIIIPKEEPMHFIDDEVECNMCGNIMLLLENESNYACFNSECTRCYEEYEEEPKQDYNEVHLKHCYQGEYEDGCKYGEDDCSAKPLEEPKQELERGITITHVGKQETLEETAEKLVPEASCELNNSEASYWQQGWISGYTKGAKWQQDRSYSEEDMRKAIQETITLMRYKATEFREHENTILKQFKKK